MPEKTLSLKFGAAGYYMLASMVVQFVNKVSRLHVRSPTIPTLLTSSPPSYTGIKCCSAIDVIDLCGVQRTAAA